MRAAKKESDYLNADGTFIGDFDGCVEYQMEVKGLAKENAEKLCVYIGRKAGKIPAREVFTKFEMRSMQKSMIDLSRVRP